MTFCAPGEIHWDHHDDLMLSDDPRWIIVYKLTDIYRNELFRDIREITLYNIVTDKEYHTLIRTDPITQLPSDDVNEHEEKGVIFRNQLPGFVMNAMGPMRSLKSRRAVSYCINDDICAPYWIGQVDLPWLCTYLGLRAISVIDYPLSEERVTSLKTISLSDWPSKESTNLRTPCDHCVRQNGSQCTRYMMGCVASVVKWRIEKHNTFKKRFRPVEIIKLVMMECIINREGCKVVDELSLFEYIVRKPQYCHVAFQQSFMRCNPVGSIQSLDLRFSNEKGECFKLAVEIDCEQSPLDGTSTPYTLTYTISPRPMKVNRATNLLGLCLNRVRELTCQKSLARLATELWREAKLPKTLCVALLYDNDMCIMY